MLYEYLLPINSLARECFISPRVWGPVDPVEQRSGKAPISQRELTAPLLPVPHPVALLVARGRPRLERGHLQNWTNAANQELFSPRVGCELADPT